MMFPDWLFTIDVLFILFLLFFGVNGFRRGLSGELAHVLSLLVLFCGFFFFFPALTKLVAGQWSDLSPEWTRVVVMVAVAGAALLLFFAGREVFKLLLKTQVSEVGDKLIGGLVGLSRGLVIGLIVLGSLSIVPSDRIYGLLTEKSMIGKWVCTTLTPWARPKIMELPVFDREGTVPQGAELPATTPQGAAY